MSVKPSETSQVDGHGVPIPHFGVVLDMESWKQLANHLKNEGVRFVIEPYIRFEGKPGEQATMFFNDPSGNALEFKGFNDMSDLFKK
jgi:extradiol dioxygenase family protein